MQDQTEICQKLQQIERKWPVIRVRYVRSNVQGLELANRSDRRESNDLKNPLTE